jgi:hypothetical protein
MTAVGPRRSSIIVPMHDDPLEEGERVSKKSLLRHSYRGAMGIRELPSGKFPRTPLDQGGKRRRGNTVMAERVKSLQGGLIACG